MGTFYFNPNPDELYHWKYKYKKRVNGKWRYYYDIGDLDGNTGSNDVGYSKLEDLLGKDEMDRKNRSADNARITAEQARKSFDDYDKYRNRFIKRESKLNEYGKNFENAAAKDREATRRYERDLDAFRKTPLGMIESFKSERATMRYNAQRKIDEFKTKYNKESFKSFTNKFENKIRGLFTNFKFRNNSWNEQRL